MILLLSNMYKRLLNRYIIILSLSYIVVNEESKNIVCNYYVVFHS